MLQALLIKWNHRQRNLILIFDELVFHFKTEDILLAK